MKAFGIVILICENVFGAVSTYYDSSQSGFLDALASLAFKLSENTRAKGPKN